MKDYDEMTAEEQEQHRQERFRLLLERLEQIEAEEQKKPPFIRLLRRVWQRISNRIELFVFELRWRVDKKLREEIRQCEEEVAAEQKK